MVTRVSAPQSDSDFELCPEGSFKCTRKIKDCEVYKKVEDGTGKLVRTDEKIPGVRFVFKVDGEDLYLMRSFKNSLHEKGNLIKFMREYSDSLLKEIRFDQNSGFAIDEDKFYNTLESMERCYYMVDVIHNEAGGKTYANIGNAEPMEELVPLAEGKVEAQAVDYDDDDIPF